MIGLAVDDLFAVLLSGMAGIVVGHPFDTTKVFLNSEIYKKTLKYADMYIHSIKF